MRILKRIAVGLLLLFTVGFIFFQVNGPWASFGMTKPIDVGYQYAIRTNEGTSFNVGGFKSLSPEVLLEGRHIAKKIAFEVTKNDKSDLEKARSLVRWTFLHIRSQSTGPDTVIQDDSLGIMRRGWGYCDQKAHVYATLATYAGIPSRQLQLFREGYGSPHTVAESFINGKWIIISTWRGFIPTNNENQPVTKEEIAKMDLMRYFEGLYPSDFLNAKPVYAYPYISNSELMNRVWNRISSGLRNADAQRNSTIPSNSTSDSDQTNLTPQKYSIQGIKNLDKARLLHLDLNYSKAIEAYKLAIKLSDIDLISDQALFWLGVAYYDAGNYEDAVNTFYRHNQLFPESAFYKSDLRFKSEILISQGKVEQAKVLLRELQTEQARVTLLLLAENKYY